MAWRKLSHDHDDWARGVSIVYLLLCHAWSLLSPGVVKFNSDGSFHALDRIMGVAEPLRTTVVVGWWAATLGRKETMRLRRRP